MSEPFVTVLTSYYNDKDFLADAISSVLAQTYTDFEYILINHASTDKSRKIAHSFNDPRIKHIDLPTNYGGSGNILIQKALDVARGKYLKTVCADDILRPDGLERLVATAQAKQADLLFGDVEFVKANKTPLGKTWFTYRYPADLPVVKYLQYFANGTSCFPYAGNFIKISELRKMAAMDHVSIQLADMGLWITMLLNGAKLSFTHDIVANYRIHKKQMCSATNIELIDRRCQFEYFLYYKKYLNTTAPLALLKDIFPKGKYLALCTEQDRELIPFALTHALYESTEIPTCILACRLKLAEILNDYTLAQHIEQKFGYTLKNLRNDIVRKPIHLLKHPAYVFKNASLKELSYFFFRKLWFIISLHDLKEKRKQHKQQEEGIV